MTVSTYALEIQAEPWTAPDSSLGRSKSGKLFPVVHKSAGLTAYQAAVKEAMAHDYPNVTPTDQPCSVSFYIWRALPSYEGNGRNVRKHRADATNLQKSLEDALQGILYENDNQVMHAETWIMEQEFETVPLIIIELEINRMLPKHVFPLDKDQLLLPLDVPDPKARVIPKDVF